MSKKAQVLLTFYGRGNLVSTDTIPGAIVGTKAERLAKKKADIAKIMAFKGATNPVTGKFEPVIDPTYYIKNHKPFPHKYFYAKDKIVPSQYDTYTRKLHWTEEQVDAMLETPCGVTAKQWEKYSDEKKIQTHAEACLEPGEFGVDFEFVF